MKKTISIILAVLMLTSVLTITATAANGPNPDKNEFEMYSASVFLYNVELDGGDFEIYNDTVVHNDAIEGATYDLETNTLTLTNFNHPELSLSLEDMGDDFKLKIEGECVIYGISVVTEDYGGSLTITGTGTLTVNPDKNDEVAVRLIADGADSTLHIDNTVSVNILSCYKAVEFRGTAHADKDTVFTQGEETVEVEGGKPVYDDYVTIDGAYADFNNGTKTGYQAHQTNDPNYIQGIYSVTLTDNADGSKTYHVEKYKYDETFRIWVKDEDFEPLDMTEEEFEGEFVIETRQSDTPKEIEYADEEGQKQTGYLVKEENEGGTGYFVIDINFNTDPTDDIHRAKPVEQNADGTYSLVATWGGYEVNCDSFFNRGLQYVYDEEKEDFYVNSVVTDEFDLYKDENGNKYVIDDDDNIYSISENNKTEIDGKEYYVLTLTQRVTEDDLEPVIEQVEGEYYDYEYPEEDYIYTASQQETGETNEATTEPVTEDVTSETGGQNQTDPINTSETSAPETEAQTVAPVTESQTAAPVTEQPQTTATKATTAATDPTVKEIKKGSSEKQVDKYVTSLKTENDAKGTVFGLLCARQKKATKKSVTVKWNKLKKAKSYLVYGSKCGTKKGQIPPYKKIKKIKGTSFTKKGLKKGVYFKFLIVALDKNNKVIASSKSVHIATKGGKVGNDKTVKVNKSKITLKAKKTFKLKGKEVPQSKKLKVKRHRPLRYESSNKKVAKVNGKGKITAKKKGTAYIYVYAQNGFYKKVKVTVK